MKNIFKLLLLSMAVSVFLTSCEDDEDTFSGPYQIVVSGAETAVPSEYQTYSIAYDYENVDNLTWSVEGSASITAGGSGASATVYFQEEGNVIVRVSDGVNTGKVSVVVANGEPTITTFYGKDKVDGEGILSDGQSDTLWVSFQSALSATPSIAMLEDSDSSMFEDESLAFESGSLGSLVKIDDYSYYAIYTAGTGDGYPEALITGLSGTGYTSDVDTAYIQLFEVDNTAPVATFSYSDDHVADSTEVTVTVEFSEAIKFESETDTIYWVSYSGAGVEAGTDTLHVTEDEDENLVYSFTYITNGEGEGDVTFTLGNIVDYADNAITYENNSFEIDNTDPTIISIDLKDDTFWVNSSEIGTAYYLISDEMITDPQISDLEEGQIVIDDSNPVGLGYVGNTDLSSLAAGTYYFYVVVQDGAGNYSDITYEEITK